MMNIAACQISCVANGLGINTKPFVVKIVHLLALSKIVVASYKSIK
ncbi:hypothetical protein C3B55_00912 [Candidatus Pseudomonas adelgestsugas]|uniref:Uncharacterized protein n=1 Tax=Candidatus Pseudomonas adelgestsugas TaxID=1302376 RepID=A0ABX5RAX5_9PSED|nr:hypothetical protein C3B55_00912 [Candidatus Pseudomonas adelgestsugas]